MTTKGIARTLVLLVNISLLLLYCTHGLSATSREVCKSCHANATCIEKDSKHYCLCNFGLIGNGKTHCLDKDECQIGVHRICGNHTACHNTHGSFYCVCLKGYRPSNNNENFIPNDGTFCTDIDECSIPDVCGYNSKCKNIPGSYECYCEEGYRLQSGTEPFQESGDKFLCTDINECAVADICGRNALCKNIPGSYECYCAEGYILQNDTEPFLANNTSFCIAIDCGSPPLIPNTIIDHPNNTTLGSIVTYRCHLGFTAYSSQHISVCTAEGNWTGPSLVCKAIDCGLPLKLPHTVIYSSSNTTFGNKVIYTCAHGFVLRSGNGTSVCTEEGTWKGADLVCEVVDWGPPPLIPYMLGLQIDTNYLSTVLFECEDVVDSGHGTATCNEDGQWVGNDLVCREINCGDPPSIPGAEIIWNGSTNLGSELQYKCMPGFYNSGNFSMSRCTLNETWQNFNFTCAEVDCGKPSIIQHADMLWNNQSTLGSSVSYVCRPGFKENNRKNVSLCTTEGVWEELNLTCTVREDLIKNVYLVNGTCISWKKSTEILHWMILYKFSILGTRWHQSDFMNAMTFNYTTDSQSPTICLELLSETNYTVTITAFSSEMFMTKMNITVQTPMKDRFGKIVVFNETCLQWTRSSEEAELLEIYTVFIYGRLWFSRDLLQNIIFNFSTHKKTPVLCLELLSAAEYFINVTETSTDLSSHVYLNISGVGNENSISSTLSNETCLQWNTSVDGLQEIYKLYLRGGRWSRMKLLPTLFFNITKDQNMSICLDLPMETQPTVQVTETPYYHNELNAQLTTATHDEEDLQNLTVLNETCLCWRRKSKMEEMYMVLIHGVRWYETDFIHKAFFNVTTHEEVPVLCLELRPATNYTVTLISVLQQQSPQEISIMTRIPEPPLPKVVFVTTQGYLPRVSFQKVEDKHGSISHYQIFVKHLVTPCSFTCESMETVTYFSNKSKTLGYITAEFLPRDIKDHLEFSVGDRKYYGNFYNAPLARGEEYCIILRIVSNWNKMKTQSCMVLAEIRDLPPPRHHMTVVLLASVAFVCFVGFMTFSIARKKLSYLATLAVHLMDKATCDIAEACLNKEVWARSDAGDVVDTRFQPIVGWVTRSSKYDICE
ncbi:LOW QUALITY PROTEIN: sushi domain-containing protein 1 [Pelodytes ibericus]